MDTFAKVMIRGGRLMVAVGALFLVGSRFGLGRLPGDIMVDTGNVKVFIPVVSMIVLSLVLTVVLNVALRIWR